MESVERLEQVLSASVDDVALMITNNPHVLKAVRGGLAEFLLGRILKSLPSVQKVVPPTHRGDPDWKVVFDTGQMLRLECKNADVAPLADGSFRLDLRRAAAGLARLYEPTAFDVVACCMHSQTGEWEYRFKAASLLDTQEVVFPDGLRSLRLDPNQRLDRSWRETLPDALADAGVQSPLALHALGERQVSTPVTVLQLPLF